MTVRQVEILFVDGCPNVEGAIERVRDALEAENAEGVDLKFVLVEGEEDARKRRFLGSPTVLVDGEDVDPGARGREGYGVQCRVYAYGEGHDGAPPVEWIQAALRKRAM
jgi:hypothetical protein